MSRSPVSPPARTRTFLLISAALVAGLALWQSAEALVSKVYRRNLIGNGATVTAGTLTHAVIDHANLVKLGKSRADGRDLLYRYAPGATTPTDITTKVGAPSGMIGYHGFDAPTLLQSPVPDCATEPSLVASWPLDTPLTNWILCGGAAPKVGTVSGATIQNGQFAQAAYLNGSLNTQVTYPLPTTLQPTLAQSLEFWVYLDAPPTIAQTLLHQTDSNDPTKERLQVTLTPSGLVAGNLSRAPTITGYVCAEPDATGTTTPNLATTQTAQLSPQCNGESWKIVPSGSCGTCTMPNSSGTNTLTSPVTSTPNYTFNAGSLSCTSGTGGSCSSTGLPTPASCSWTTYAFNVGSSSCTSGTTGSCSSTGVPSPSTCSWTTYTFSAGSGSCTSGNTGSCSSTGVPTPSSCTWTSTGPDECASVGCPAGCTSSAFTAATAICTSPTCGGGCARSMLHCLSCPNSALNSCLLDPLHNPSNTCAPTPHVASNTCSITNYTCTKPLTGIQTDPLNTCDGTSSAPQPTSSCGTCTQVTGYTCTEPGSDGKAVASPTPVASGTATAACNGETWTSTTACGNCTINLESGTPYKTAQWDITVGSPQQILNVTSNTPIPLRRWTHVAIIADPGDLADPVLTNGDSVAIYLNGALDKLLQPAVTDPSTGKPLKEWGLIPSSLPFVIGGGSPINGSVDAVAYYKRTLSATEVWQHYQAGASVDGVASGNSLLSLSAPTRGAGLLGQGLVFAPVSTSYGTYAMSVDPLKPINPINPLRGLLAWTLELWVKPQANSGTILSAWDAQSAEKYVRLELNSSGIPQLAVNGASIFSTALTGIMTLNQWHHLALEMDGASTKVFIDGQQAISGAAVSIPATATTPLLLGAYLGSTVGTSPPVSVPANFFTGMMDEFVIHNRSLSVDELTARAQMGAAGSVWNPGLGLSNSALFLTPSPEVISPLPTASNYWLLYGPTRTPASLPFCGQPPPTPGAAGAPCDQPGTSNDQLGAATASAAPVILGAEITDPIVSMTTSGNHTYSVLMTTAQPAPSVTIKDEVGGSFTTVRVQVPSSLSPTWDPASAPTATSTPPATLTLLNGNKTLQAALASALPAGGTLTLSGLQLSGFTQAGKDQLWIDINDPTCTDAATCAEAQDSTFLTVSEGLVLTAPSSQVPNALSSEGSLTGLNLLRFGVKAAGGAVNVNQISVSYTALEIDSADLTNLVLQPLGWPEVTPRSPGVFKFIGSGTISKDQTVEYTVRGDVARLGDQTQCTPCKGDVLTVSIAGTSTTLVGAGASSLASADVGDQCTPPACSKTHKLNGYSVSFSPSSVVVGDAVSITWGGLGNFDSNVAISFSPQGTLNGPGSVTVCQTPGPNPCGASGSSLSWLAPDAITTAGQFWISGAVTIDGFTQAVSVQSKTALTITGQLTLTAPVALSEVPVNTPLDVTWTRKGSFPVDVFFSTDNGISFAQVGTASATAVKFTWSPTQTTAQALVKICGSASAAPCQTSGVFKVSGISVTAPKASDPPYLIGPTGVTVPIAWNATGVSLVDLYYCTNGCGTFSGYTRITTGGSIGAASSPYNWNVPTTFPDLSGQMRIRVVNASSVGAFGESEPFTLRGDLRMTLPAANSAYRVGDAVSLSWTTYGGIPTVSLEYSTDGSATSFGTARPLVDATGSSTQNIANSGSFNWTIPDDVISNNLRLRVVDAVSGHPFAAGTVGPLTVGAVFTWISPTTAGTNWAVNRPSALAWTTKGTGVTNVKIEYSTDNFVTPKVYAASVANAGTQNFVTPNLLAPLTGNPLVDGATVSYSKPFAIRISDATPGHPSVPTPSVSLNAIYYKVTWEVRNAAVPTSFIPKLQVSDSETLPGYPQWTNAPNFDLGPGPVVHWYPYDTTISTIWTASDGSNTSLSQGPSDAKPMDFWTSDQDQTRVVMMELVSSDAITWTVHAEYNYDLAANAVQILAWLEKAGRIVDAQTIPATVYVELYEDGTLIRTLPQPQSAGPGVAPDANSSFRLTWDLKRSDGTDVPDGKTYFAKTIIQRLGRSFSTGGAVNITIPKKILTSGTGSSGGLTADQDIRLKNIETTVGAVPALAAGQLPLLQAVNEIHQNTVGPTSALEKVKNELTTPQLADGTKTVRGMVQETHAEVTDATTPGTLKQKVIAILEDKTAGLPKVLENQTTVQNQLKAQRKGKILNRETTIEQGDSVVFHYLPGDPATVPTIKIYGPNFSVGPVSMAPDGSGLYQFSQTFDNALQVGEYTVMVTEGASASGLSNGTVDTLSLKLHAPLAGAQDLAALQSKVDALLTKLDIEVIPKLAAVDTSSTQVQGLVTQVQTDTQALSKQLDTLPIQDLKNQVANLIDKMGSLAAAAPAGSNTAAGPGAGAPTTSPPATTQPNSDTGTLLQRLDALKKAVESAQGSSAAVGLSQNAYNAASEAVSLLHQLQAALQAKGLGAANGPAILGKFGDKLSSISDTVTVIPGKMTGDELREQLKRMAEQAKAVATEKGYQFDSLYEMTKSQRTDVKTVRNQVEELKQLLDVQRSIIERNMNQPVVKSWFESN